MGDEPRERKISTGGGSSPAGLNLIAMTKGKNQQRPAGGLNGVKVKKNFSKEPEWARRKTSSEREDVPEWAKKVQEKNKLREKEEDVKSKNEPEWAAKAREKSLKASASLPK